MPPDAPRYNVCGLPAVWASDNPQRERPDGAEGTLQPLCHAEGMSSKNQAMDWELAGQHWHGNKLEECAMHHRSAPAFWGSVFAGGREAAEGREASAAGAHAYTCCVGNPDVPAAEGGDCYWTAADQASCHAAHSAAAGARPGGAPAPPTRPGAHATPGHSGGQGTDAGDERRGGGGDERRWRSEL